jgi:hypothetical protein
MSTDRRHYREFALALAPAAAAVANYCDHAEHNEVVDRGWVTTAGATLERLAFDLAPTVGVDLLAAYAERLGSIERRNVLAGTAVFDGARAASSASTWRELQLVQAEHDRVYHPDVLGLSRSDQLRHYAFHLAKLVGAFATSDDDVELLARRLPDTLLFAIKLRTVMGERLPEEPLASSTDPTAAA